MKKFVFVVGGVRSGKSRYAVERAQVLGKKIVFLATAVPIDAEMTERIRRHRQSRPAAWKTVEEDRDLAAAFGRMPAGCDTVLVDCLGVFIANLLTYGMADDEITAALERFIAAASKGTHQVIVVSNEVGMGVVPESPVGRRFRDMIGLANQLIAAAADEVVVMQCGIPLVIKGGDVSCARLP